MSWEPEHIAWMAGLFEGEGCVLVPKRNSPLRVKFTMTDGDVLEKFAGIAGYGCVSGPFKPSGLGKKPLFEYHVSGKKAYALVVALWWFLGKRRRGQAECAIKAFATTSHYRKLTNDQVRQIKSELGNHGAGRRLAKRYGVSEGMICAIKQGKAWNHIHA